MAILPLSSFLSVPFPPPSITPPNTEIEKPPMAGAVRPVKSSDARPLHRWKPAPGKPCQMIQVSGISSFLPFLQNVKKKEKKEETRINIYKNTPKPNNKKNKDFFLPRKIQKKFRFNKIQLAHCRRRANGSYQLTASIGFSLAGLNTLSLMECLGKARKTTGHRWGQTRQKWARNGHTALTARLNCQGAPALTAVMRPMAPRSRLFLRDDDCRTQPTNKQSYWSIKSNETL